MSFPETRQTLIQRLASTGSEQDWHQFLNDYWGPVCRFAANRASLSNADAEDVASLTFEVLLTNQLLSRWVLNRSAKLRTLVCSVVRNVLSNRARVNQGRERILQELAEQGFDGPTFQNPDGAGKQVDIFYAAWAADLLEQVMESLLDEYHAAGKGDYFRVLYGKICEEMSMPEIAEALSIPLTSVENYYKSARKRIAKRLEELVRAHVARYSSAETQEVEWQKEWSQLGEYLKSHSGLEELIRQAATERPSSNRGQRKKALISATLLRARLETPPPK